MSPYDRKQANTIIEQLCQSNSMPNRIAANCVWCIYDDAVKGTWQQQVEACDMHGCPLYDVRMGAIERKD